MKPSASKNIKPLKANTHKQFVLKFINKRNINIPYIIQLLSIFLFYPYLKRLCTGQACQSTSINALSNCLQQPGSQHWLSSSVNQNASGWITPGKIHSA